MIGRWARDLLGHVCRATLVRAMRWSIGMAEGMSALPCGLGGLLALLVDRSVFGMEWPPL
jgi:ABC-type Fe3+ transport system permease subunit